MGVPVISLAGDRHASRVGVSLLNRIEMADLAAADEEEYIAIACDLACDQDRLVELRRGLRDRMRASKLMDEKGFVRQMEGALRQMLRLKASSPAAV